MSSSYVVRFEDDGAEYTVEAHSAEHAAEEATERWEDDCAEHPVANGKLDVQVRVREAGTDGPWQHFKVCGEWTATYMAFEADAIAGDGA